MRWKWWVLLDGAAPPWVDVWWGPMFPKWDAADFWRYNGTRSELYGAADAVPFDVM